MDKWIEEDKAVRCLRCASYIDYEDSRGWCDNFNRPARDSHPMTDDCRQNGAITLAPVAEEDLEYSPYRVGDLIKVIEPNVRHNSWAEYRVIEVNKNEALYRSSQSYFNESRWYYRLQTPHQRQLWLAENQICHASESHLICTEEIF